MNGIPESDWKLLRKLRNLLLDRFCEGVLQDIQRVTASPDKNAHERYLAIYRLIRDRDEDLAVMFNHNSRSKAYLLLLGAHTRKLITADELRQFTPDTQAYLAGVARDLE